MEMAGSSSNQSFHPNQYPYPSHVIAPNFVSVKLNGKSTYNVWYYQMLSLLRSHDMFGFINGKIANPRMHQKATVEHMEAWIKSDSLVRGWILGSLSDQVAINVVNRLKTRHGNREFTAKDAWDELQRIHGPSLPKQPAEKEMIKRNEWKLEHEQQIARQEIPLQQIPEEHIEPIKEAEKDMADNKNNLYSYIVRGQLGLVEYFYHRRHFPVTSKLTTNDDTPLHVAVGASTNNQNIFNYFLKKLPERINLWDVRNLDGSTLLHVAAIVGNTEAAKILIKTSASFLLAKDNKGHTPLAISLSNMHTETSNCMLDHIDGDEEESRKYDTLFTGPRGDELLVLAISSKDFRLAERLLGHYETIHSEAVLMALAQNFTSDLGFWGRLAYDERSLTLRDYLLYQRSLRDLIKEWTSTISGFFITRGNNEIETEIDFRFVKHSIKIIIMVIVRPFVGKRVERYHSIIKLMDRVFWRIKRSTDVSNYHLYYSNTVFEATRQNAYKVVIDIVEYFPDAIWSVNEDGHNFIQFAVINRSEKIYNLLYKMSEHRNIYKTVEDSSGNNLLHLAARLAPTNKLKTISGAALQMQRELQWFKEVQGFVCPLNIIQKNYAGETPEMVFSREHKDLVIEGEKWMKTTAESYTITAALITTIVFAAAITVPGGNDQNKGTPLFTNKPAFTIFAISDAVSLFTAVTSLLMFLSILTTRFAEQDFLFKLPKRLIIGLATLFISTTAMIVAFAATLFLVFGQESLWVLIPIGALTCLPIISFVTLQFPLIFDLISATYGHSIFYKTKSDRPFY